MKLFFFRIHEQNGEQEYTYDHITQAKDLDEALEKAEKYASTFYGECDEVEEMPDRKTYWFNGWTITIYVSDIYETTKEEFLETIYLFSLVP